MSGEEKIQMAMILGLASIGLATIISRAIVKRAVLIEAVKHGSDLEGRF